MAIRTESLQLAPPQARAHAVSHLAALPSGAVVAVFDSRVDAAGSAVHLAAENPDRSAWIATGAQAALKVRAAREARSFLHRLIGGLSDDEAAVQRVIDQAEAGSTVLVTVSRDASTTLSRLAGARHVVEFGRWTTRTLR